MDMDAIIGGKLWFSAIIAISKMVCGHSCNCIYSQQESDIRVNFLALHIELSVPSSDKNVTI